MASLLLVALLVLSSLLVHCCVQVCCVSSQALRISSAGQACGKVKAGLRKPGSAWHPAHLWDPTALPCL